MQSAQTVLEVCYPFPTITKTKLFAGHPWAPIPVGFQRCTSSATGFISETSSPIVATDASTCPC